MGQVIGIDTNAVPANQSGPEWQEIPFGPRRLQDGFGINVHFIEDYGQLIDQRDIQVTLGVLDHLGRLCHTDAAGFVGTGDDDLVVQRIDQISDLRG